MKFEFVSCESSRADNINASSSRVLGFLKYIFFEKYFPHLIKIAKKGQLQFMTCVNIPIFSDLSPFYCIASLGASYEPVRV